MNPTLQQAISHQQVGRLQEAGEIYLAVLQNQPKHPQANHNMGVLAVQMNQPAAALPYFEAALSADPACAQYWLSYIDALFQAGQLEDARQILALARQQGLQGEDVNTLTAQLEGNVPVAATIPQKTETKPRPKTGKAAGPSASRQIKSPPPQEINILVGLFSQGRYAEAETLAQTMTDRFPLHGPGWLVLGAILKQTGRTEDALIPLQKAATLLPDNADAHLNLGVIYKVLGRLDEAAASYRQALNVKPDMAEAFYNLGNTLKDLGRLDEAADSYRRALQFIPNNAMVHSNLGAVLHESGRFDEASQSYRQSLDIEPNSSDSHYNLGAVLQKLNRINEAEPCFRRALAINPYNTEAHCKLGTALYDLGRLAEAETCHRQALAINADCIEAHNNLGMTLKALGRLSEAEASYRRAIQINPEHAEVHSNLGSVLKELGRLDEAEASYRRALQLNPDLAEAYNNLGNTLNRLGRLDESEACLRRVLQLKPDYAEAHINLGATLMDLGHPHEAVASYRRALSINRNFPDVHDNLLFTLSLHASEPAKQNEEIMLAARQYDEQFCLPHRAVWQQHRNNRDPNRRLRIGYVSPDFRRHAVAYFAEPIFARHDKSQVEIFCYAEVTAEDDYTARFQKLADYWHSTIGLSDDQVAVMIREHQIDILVDLAGHTSKNRLLVFARKPAPLQMTYLGYPGTSGLSTMDYRLTDRHADPEGMTESHYVEQLLRLPDSLYCYRPSVDMPEPSVLPTLARGYLTFGSFNNANKIDQRTLNLWAELLRTVPTARLIMLTMPEGELRLRWIRRFEALGIDAQRLEFHGKLPTAEFHRKFLEVDISLDTVSVSGGTTTCESLWMGVPVIACVGERFITRVSHSCLSTVGLSEFSASTPEDYVRIAARFANDIPRLAEIRAGLRDRLRASPLVDEVRFARNLENVYRDIWIRWCGA